MLGLEQKADQSCCVVDVLMCLLQLALSIVVCVLCERPRHSRMQGMIPHFQYTKYTF